MPLRRIILALLPACALAACATPVNPTPSPTAPVAATATQAPPTEAPPATQAPPTQAPTAPATAAPTAAPATAAPPTAAPATAAPPTSAPATAAPTAFPATPVASTEPAPSGGGELLFLRGGDLYALDGATGQPRAVASGVRDFAASPAGDRIALVRGAGLQAELWVVQRDGSGLARLTDNNRAEATPSWAPDGAALLFGSSSSAKPYVREWPGWSEWCGASEIHELKLSSQAETKLADGCDPAVSPDGRRIAFATRPNGQQEGSPVPNINNTIRLINRQGQNGWSFAVADGGLSADPAKAGLLVYAPAWSPDGAQIVYHRFLGYQALVDLDISQIAGSFKGGGQPVADGAGWLLPARFAPGGKLLAIVENNYSDARGFGGYDNWRVSVIRLEGSREIALPSGSVTAVGQLLERLPRGQTVAWSPDGARLAVVLPPGWRPDLPDDQPLQAGEQPGEIWLWAPGQPPAQKLAAQVDFGSPLVWLP